MKRVPKAKKQVPSKKKLKPPKKTHAWRLCSVGEHWVSCPGRGDRDRAKV